MFQTRCLNTHFALVRKGIAVPLGCACWGVVGLEIAQQTLQAFLVRIMVFPVGKVPDMACPADTGGPWQACLLDRLIQGDGKEGRFLAALFFLKRGYDLAFYPLTIHGMFRKDDQELIIHADRLINTVPKLLSNFQVLWSIPAPDAIGLQVGIEPFDKLLIFTGMADKALVVLYRVLSQGMSIGDEGLCDACSAQEYLRNIAFRLRDGIRANGRRVIMLNCFQSSDGSQINISKDRPSYLGSGEVGSTEVGSTEVGHAEVGSAEIGSAEVGFAEVGFAEVKGYIWMLLSPCIPGLYSLTEKIKLLLVCHSVHLLCGALIIERCKPMRKIAHCFFFLPGPYGGVICRLLVVQLETRCLNADFVRGAL
jgi:hypothetical protein